MVQSMFVTSVVGLVAVCCGAQRCVSVMRALNIKNKVPGKHMYISKCNSLLDSTYNRLLD